MSTRLSVILFVLFSSMFTALTGDAQERKRPQKVATSTGIYDVESPGDIHKFSASEIRDLVRMENDRAQERVMRPHPVLIYCFEERTFRYTGGKYQDQTIRYRLHAPKTIRDGQKYPLVIHLHGLGEAGSNNTSSLVHLHSLLPLMIGPKQKDFFLLVVQCHQKTPRWNFQTTKDGTLDVLMAAMEHVIAENPIDKRRITVTGISSGGYGVWQLLLRYPDMFAGAVPTACEAPHPSQQLVALKKTPIWSFINKEDHQVSSETIQVAMRVINSSGGSMALTVCDAPKHNAWRPAMDEHNSFQWLLAQKRGSWFAPPPGVFVYNDSSPVLLVLLMYVLPVSVIVFLLRGTIYGFAPTVFKPMNGRTDKNRP